MIDWKKYPNFTEKDFTCKHTGLCDMQEACLTALQALRTEYGKPMVITSGYRHPSHPIEAKKGHSDGEHTTGNCFDVACGSGSERYALVKLALKHGFHRIGIAKTFIHLGLGSLKLPPNVIWEYQ